MPDKNSAPPMPDNIDDQVLTDPAAAGLSFSWQNGTPIATGTDARLATWLNTDVQGSVEFADQIICALADPDYDGELTGNAHCVSIRPQTVLLQSLFDDSDVDRRLQREELLQAVQAWRRFIATPK